MFLKIDFEILSLREDAFTIDERTMELTLWACPALWLSL
jgi:hypothetical protein